MHTSLLEIKHQHQHQFKNGVPQGDILSPTLFNTYTYDTTTPQAPVKLRTYTDNIAITSTHNDMNIALTLLIHKHLQLHASQYKQKTQHPSHLLHKYTTYFNTPRLKTTIFNNGYYTTNIPRDPPHSHYNRHKNKHVPYT